MTLAPNTEQLAAIGESGVVFVSAGAGTGKTTVLVERFARAVIDRGVPADSLLVITYTERAAGELRARIRGRFSELDRHDLALEVDRAWISTIHGFCSRVLRAHPFEAGLDPRFRVLDDNQARILRSEAFDEALAAFCRGREEERLRLLATYGARDLKRMLGSVFERLRSAGRKLALAAEPGADLEGALDELREQAAGVIANGEGGRTAELLSELLDGQPRVDDLLDLSELTDTRDDGSVALIDAASRVENAALELIAARDRTLLEVLLADFDARYRTLKGRESAVDFEDLQLITRELLQRDQPVREALAWRFRSIMVDEFQDTNRLQCELIDLIAGDELFFVGDEFQSIYRFRHADVEVFRERRAQSGGVLALTQNYRSRPEVLGVVNHIFRSEFGEDFAPLTAAGRFPDPAFGPAVEVLVTDRSAYRARDESWRRAEAESVAARVAGLVEAGECEPGDVVLLFAAGTSAEAFEVALRERGLPTHRATGRGYYGQQQVVDLLAYLRLLQNRYDDVALVSVLASPLVGVSNDTLIMLRRAASRRPIFGALERGLPSGIPAAEARLLAAFRQRFDRLVALAEAAGLEALCEQIVVEHDYDLAVLARWDGRRRYANVRKLARLARSFEELRGPDLEGFIAFVRDLDSVGAREGEAVAEEEGSDAVRLMTIHAAKGLEFKVVVVADCGRTPPRVSSSEILCLPDGRFGFSVADPGSSERLPGPGYEEVRSAEETAEGQETRRLYYVAMTRSIDRLIVSGSIDPTRNESRPSPISWVLGSLDATLGDDDRLQIETGGVPVQVQIDRGSEAGSRGDARDPASELEADAQLALFDPGDDSSAVLLPSVELGPLPDVPVPPTHPLRRLSYSALALYDRCALRFWAERFAGLRPRDGRAGAGTEAGMNALEIGDAVHAAIELNVAAGEVNGWLVGRYPRADADDRDRVAELTSAWRTSGLARELDVSGSAVRPELGFVFEYDDVLFHGRVDLYRRRDGDVTIVDFKTNRLNGDLPDTVVDRSYGHQLTVYALAALRSGASSVTIVYAFLERPDEPVRRTFTAADTAQLEARLHAALEAIRAGEFQPTPDPLTCGECPLLDLACAGPALVGRIDEDPSRLRFEPEY